MNLIGKKVRSNKYGLATIKEELPNKLIVSLDTNNEILPLCIPDAFESKTFYNWIAIEEDVQKYILKKEVLGTASLIPFEVIHDTWGNGTAIKIVPSIEYPKDRFIIVKFKSFEKSFPYPDVCYFKHLRAINKDIQKEIEKDIKEYINRPIPPTQPIKEGWRMYNKAYDTYIHLCKKFGWKESNAYLFKRLQTMYAAKATPEGYGVSFFVHNSLCESYNEEYSWFNKVYFDKIEEIWFCNYDFLHNMDTRVIFLKTKNGYEFSGIYEPITIETRTINGKERKVKIYKKTSNQYPLESTN